MALLVIFARLLRRNEIHYENTFYIPLAGFICVAAFQSVLGAKPIGRHSSRKNIIELSIHAYRLAYS